jgi:alpha-L-fucosidase
MTMHDSGWGFVRSSPAMQTAPQLLGHLVTAAAGEGNFLLNVGPKADGTVRKEERERLSVIGRWMKVNGEAIYGSQRCALSAGPVGHWTRKGTTGYLVVQRWPGREVTVPMLKTPAESAELLGADATLKLSMRANGRMVISGLPAKPPVPPFGVIKVRFAVVPEKGDEPDRAAFLKGKL